MKIGKAEDNFSHLKAGDKVKFSISNFRSPILKTIIKVTKTMIIVENDPKPLRFSRRTQSEVNTTSYSRYIEPLKEGEEQEIKDNEEKENIVYLLTQKIDFKKLNLNTLRKINQTIEETSNEDKTLP